MNDELKRCPHGVIESAHVRCKFCDQSRVSRQPVEAQAKECVCLHDGFDPDCPVHCPQSAPQPPPPAAETREEREGWVNVYQERLSSLFESKEYAESVREPFEGNTYERTALFREVLPHPEPQAPRVSEDAMISLKSASESMHFYPRVDREICRELFRALSQPAQGERKTEED